MDVVHFFLFNYWQLQRKGDCLYYQLTFVKKQYVQENFGCKPGITWLRYAIGLIKSEFAKVISKVLFAVI